MITGTHGRRRCHGRRDRLGNPKGWKRYLGRLLTPSRATWQKPKEVVRKLGLRRGQTVCEVGAGPGFFAFHLARAVGPRGRVYAVDAAPRMLELLGTRLGRSRWRNITPVLGLRDHPLLPLGACDLILMVNTYHHVPDGPPYLRRLARALRPGGRIVNIDFHRRETPVGPPVEHRVDRADFISDARRAGLRLIAEFDMLRYQYFLVLTAR